MLEFCLLMLASLVLICGAFVEQIEEQTRHDLTVSSADYMPEMR